MLAQAKENLRYMLSLEISKQIEQNNKYTHTKYKLSERTIQDVSIDLVNEILNVLQDHTYVIIHSVHVGRAVTVNMMYARLEYYSDCRIGIAEFEVNVDILQ